MIKFYIILTILLCGTSLYSQNVGIGDVSDFIPDSSSLLELRSSVRGFLLPRVTRAERIVIPFPAHGLLVIQTDDFGGEAAGIWYYHMPDTKWYLLMNSQTASSIAWTLTGNAGTNPAINFIGTSDAVDLSVKTNSTEALRIVGNATKTGFIGINESTPSQRLTVKGNLMLEPNGTTPSELRFSIPNDTAIFTSFKTQPQASSIKYCIHITFNSGCSKYTPDK